jgi:glycosyltransferase involved in cell wall biosynthesis
MKKIIIISFTDLKNDPRVNRQIRHLSKRFAVTAFGLKDPQVENVTFKPVTLNYAASLEKKIKEKSLLLLRRFNRYFDMIFAWQTADSLKQPVDLIIANDVESLPLAFRLSESGNIPVICDCHEYAPLEFAHRFRWRLLHKPYNSFLCKKYLPRCRHVFTVSKGIAQAYFENYNVKPTVITNACDFVELAPSDCREDKIQLIHHGSAQPNRKIEKMLEVMKYTAPGFHLTLMLVPGNQDYIDFLKKKYRHLENITFIPPVPMAKITDTLNRYDIGLYMLEPANFNNKMALPNKLFEFIQSRLALAIGPSPEMAEIVKKYDCGIVCDAFSSKKMADALNRLTIEDIRYYKQQSHKFARELSAVPNMEHLDEVADEILKLATGGME